ncbi:hypothetical protein [Leptospira ryugenii]|nr:hypothetical protein [Leptospira ryugenii]
MPPQSIQNYLVSYNSTLHGEEIVAPIFSDEPILLSGDDGEEYFLLGEDEDTGLLVYGFEDENEDTVLVYGDYDGNIHEIETLEGFGGFKGFKGFKGIKLPKAPKLPKFKTKFRAPKFKAKGLTKGFRNVGKSVSKATKGVQKGISSGVKAYGKAWSDVGKGLSKGVSNLAKGAGDVLSQVAEGAGGLLNPEGSPEEPEEEEEEQTEEDFESGESYEDIQSEEDPETSESIEEDEMNGELGFAQFIPMAMSAASTMQQGAAQKKQARNQAKNKRNTAILDLIRKTKAPVKVKRASSSKVSSIKVARPTVTAPSKITDRSAKAGGVFDSEITHSIKEDSKLPLILGGVAVIGVIFLVGKKSK